MASAIAQSINKEEIMEKRATIFSWGAILALAACSLNAENRTTSHGLSFHDSPAYPEGFSHFNYANPNAPKGGTLRKGATGTFDTFNTFTPKGNWAEDSYLLYDPLMVKAGDEPYTVYGLVADKIEYPENFQWVAYRIHPEARFHDGAPITADDVVYTFETLREKGPPHYRHLYADITSVT
ncbi:MAG: ABC transporter substrate-binding protein, partial [Endozoicomonas sp.]